MIAKLDVTEKQPTSSGDTTSSEKTSPSTPTSVSTAAATGTAIAPGTSFLQARPPPIPYWFNREVKNRLMMIGSQAPMAAAPSSSTSTGHFVPALPPPMSREETKEMLKYQLEFYFSRENLFTDKFLKSQMDGDQFVPIEVLANFRRIVSLTTDFALIAEAAKESAHVELDETGTKVRPDMKRTTIIIREIPEEYREEVVKLLADGPPFTDLKYGSNESWYVTFEKELDTQVAYVAVQRKRNEITGRQVCARIKAGGVPMPPLSDSRTNENGRNPAVPNSGTTGGTIQMRSLGQTLCDYGFVPVATYRPGEAVLSMYEYETPTFSFRGNNNVPYQPPPSTSPQLADASQYYSAATTPTRQFDEMSTASSNSTRTTASFYRNGASQYNESRGFPSHNSNEWRGRFNGGGGGPSSSTNHHETNGYRGGQPNRRGGWRGGGYRQNQNQNTRGTWRHEPQKNGYSNNYHQNYNRPPPRSSSSSSTSSSRYFSPEAVSTPVASVPNTPPPQQTAPMPTYRVPTPTDLPAPPVWPAPNYDKRRKSSETSSVTATETLTPNTPVTAIPTATRPVFVEKAAEASTATTMAEPKSPPVKNNGTVEKEKVESPAPEPPVPSFSFEETAFPSLPAHPEPERKPAKPTFR
uniref:HTH La-type RNA-binding domain-containing protein n=1 Tax=Caenorhabditis japonica TaxID=281687 RepID=A0A8R1DSP1_CAEJA